MSLRANSNLLHTLHRCVRQVLESQEQQLDRCVRQVLESQEQQPLVQLKEQQRRNKRKESRKSLLSSALHCDRRSKQSWIGANFGELVPQL